MPNCYYCRKELHADSDYGRQDQCDGCGRSTHVCLNCIFFDRSRYNECAESAAERVVDKEKANFCDYFKPKSLNTAGPAEETPAQKAKRMAEELFKKKG